VIWNEGPKSDATEQEAEVMLATLMVSATDDASA
jgi:hypothetical protein